MSIGLTLLGQTLAFAVFVWVCMRYIWPPIVQAMAERQTRIAQGLEKAEQASRELEAVQKRATEELRKAREEAAALLEQARVQSAAMIEEARDAARAEGERIRNATRSEIDQELTRAREVLRGELSELVIEGAEKVLEQSVPPAAHSRMLDQLAARL